HGDIHDRVVGRILHGDLRRAAEHRLKACRQLKPTGVKAFAPGKRIEAALLHTMNELARIPVCRNEVVPATRDVRLFIKAENMSCNRVAMMMIVEEPPIMPRVAQGELNRLEVHTEILRGSGGAGRGSKSHNART